MAFGLNIFRTITADLTTVGAEIYTAPSGYSAILLSAQVSNNTAGVIDVTAAVLNLDSSETRLIDNFSIPGNDAAGLLDGKLVLEEGYGFTASASANSALTIVISLLESKNS
jgi:hypothetical protein